MWDLDGTLIPADLRWLRRAVAHTYRLAEDAVVFPGKRVHGYTDESIVVDTAVVSGLTAADAEAGVPRFYGELGRVMEEGRGELARETAALPGCGRDSGRVAGRGLRADGANRQHPDAAVVKVSVTWLAEFLDLDVGGFGSDARDRLALPAIVAQRFADRYQQVLDPDRTVLIGDAANDVATARHGGFHAVAVAHRISRDELARYGPDAILDGLVPEMVVKTIHNLIR